MGCSAGGAYRSRRFAVAAGARIPPENRGPGTTGRRPQEYKLQCEAFEPAVIKYRPFTTHDYMVFSPRALASSIWGSSTPRVVTAANVEQDLANVHKRVTALGSALSGLKDGSGVLAALSVHKAALTLDAAVKAAAKDVTNIPQPFGEADATAVLNAVQGSQATFLEALEIVVVKKPVFEALIGDIPAIVKQDLASIDTSMKTLGQELLVKVPEDMAAYEQALFVSIDAAFATALAGYTVAKS